MLWCPPMITEVFNKRYQSQKSLQTLQLLSDFWKLWLFVITNKYPDRKRRFYLFKIPTSYDSEKMSIIMSGHETCKNGKKIKKKNSWARECIFSSHRPQKSMKKHMNNHQRGEILNSSRKLVTVQIWGDLPWYSVVIFISKSHIS